MKKILALLAAATLAGGCGTARDILDDGGRVYGGVRKDANEMAELRTDCPCLEPSAFGVGFECNPDPCLVPIYPFDLLLCVPADTILLPYTVTRHYLTRPPAPLAEPDVPAR